MWSLSGSRISHCSRRSSSSSGSGRSFGSVVEDVQAAAAGGNDVGYEFGAVGANVAQRAAVRVQVGELLLHRAAGQAAQRPAAGNSEENCLYSEEVLYMWSKRL